ncbi:MAG: ribbon-helix-helix protein, CopG family [ANME-2 cluster archaeon]|nr:ribbon-helix-helix protein, CopG family [ANME-2 cluster archaeon]
MTNSPDVIPNVRATVSLSSDVSEALDDLVKSGKFDNRSQAIRRAVRIAFIEQSGGGIL